MNYNNLAQKTNYLAGSDKLEFTSFYLTSVNIPGIAFSHPELGGREGVRLNLQGDSITYNSLSMELLVDEDFKIYHEFMDKVTQSINPEAGTFNSIEFDFWIQINNSKGNKLFKIYFYNCRLENIGDIQLDTQDDLTEWSLPVDLKYDYFKVERETIIPTERV